MGDDFSNYIHNILLESTTSNSDDEFNQWFAGSKITDSDGNPLLLYHGSPKSNIKQIKPAADDGMIWFTDNIKVSAIFSGNTLPIGVSLRKDKIYRFLMNNRSHISDVVDNLTKLGFDVKREEKLDKYGFRDGYRFVITTPKVGSIKYIFSEWSRVDELFRRLYPTGRNYTVALNIKNPLVVNANSRNWSDIKFNDKITSSNLISLWANKNGYDGVIFYDMYEGGIKSNVYVAFDKSQVKIRS
jgi:hypothetical protein